MGQTYDRSAGALVGLAVGDSLGATLEFQSPNNGTPHTEITGGGAFNWAPGAPTDDSDMAAGMVRAYLTNPGNPVRAAADNWVKWYESGPADIGGTTAGSLRRVQSGADIRTTGSTADNSAANGSLMRCIPTAVVRKEDRLRRMETAAMSVVTHGEQRCIDSTVVYNDIASWMIDGATAKAAVERSLRESPMSLPVRETIQRAVAMAAAGADRNAVLNGLWESGGYVLTSLGLAIWAILSGLSFEDALVTIVNMGGDADTNGAIAGGLLGARDGISAIPSRWTDIVMLTDEFVTAATAFTAQR